MRLKRELVILKALIVKDKIREEEMTKKLKQSMVKTTSIIKGLHEEMKKNKNQEK